MFVPTAMCSLGRSLIRFRAQIAAADVVLADITGNNANVFFELGLADAAGKPIIFLTQDDPDKAPVDVKPAEKIVYDLSRHRELLDRLDNALRNVFGDRHRQLYDFATNLLKRFNKETGLTFDAATYDEFHARVEQDETTVGLPDADDVTSIARFTLPKIVEESHGHRDNAAGHRLARGDPSRYVDLARPTVAGAQSSAPKGTRQDRADR